LAQRRAGIRTGRGPKPPASARTAPDGRWPLLFPGLAVCSAPFRAGGGNAGRVS